MEHKILVLQSILPFLFSGMWMTFKISMLAILIGSALGMSLGILRSLPYWLLRNAIGLYLHLFRGTPFLVQIYLFYFVLPSLNIPWLEWDSFLAAIICLSLYTASYVTEITLAAILAVGGGQEEAARSVGMSKVQSLRYVIMPQALKLMVPPMSGVYVIIIKSTALLSVIGVSEMTRQGEISILRFQGDVMFIYAVVAVLYFAYCYPVLRFARWAEDKLGTVKVNLD